MAHGVPQADGHIAEEPVMDVENVADAIVYVAGLPKGVNVLVSFAFYAFMLGIVRDL